METITATEFRKNLFSLLERVLRGEEVEITYKGSAIRLAKAGNVSKLARAKRQHALLCDPDSIVGTDASLQHDMEAEWVRDWKKV